MRKPLILVGKLAVAGTIVAAPVGLAVSAQAGPYDVPSTVSNTSPAPGGTLTLTGSGFRPNSAVTIEIHSTVQVLGTATANANGVVSARVTIPAGMLAGTAHTLVITGVDAAGRPRVVSIPVTLAGSVVVNPGPSLPFTGIDAIAVGATSAGLIGFGSFVVFTNRRRKAARES